MGSLVNSPTHAVILGLHLCEVDFKFAPGLLPGWVITRTILAHASPQSAVVTKPPVRPHSLLSQPSRGGGGSTRAGGWSIPFGCEVSPGSVHQKLLNLFKRFRRYYLTRAITKNANGSVCPLQESLQLVDARRQVCEFVVDLVEGLVDPGHKIPQDQKNYDEPDTSQDQELVCGPEIDHGLDF